MIKHTEAALVVGLILSAFAVSASGQSSDQGRRPPVLRSTTVPDNQDQGELGRQSGPATLITVPAIVMDRNGRYIGSLRKEDFVIYENGVEQEVTYFGSIEQPFTVALLLDVSGSTQTQLQAIRSAANAFINRLRPNDQIMLVSFDGKVNILTEAVKVSELRKLK